MSLQYRFHEMFNGRVLNFANTLRAQTSQTAGKAMHINPVGNRIELTPEAPQTSESKTS